MSAQLLEPFSKLVSDFNFRRALSLISLLLILGGAAWVIDYYSDYSKISRLERVLSLVERIDAIDRKGSVSVEIRELRTNLLRDLALLTTTPVQPLTGAGQLMTWFSRIWPKFLAGGLPWFALSLFAMPGIIRGEKNSVVGFISLQFFTIFFGLVSAVIPTTGSRAIDYALLPWGIIMVIGIIPTSIAAASGYRKVRDSSIQKTITNNLRQVAAAADQYFLEKGVAEARVSDLVGPDKYIRNLTSVDGESYEDIVVRQGQPIVINRRSGDPVMYAP